MKTNTVLSIHTNKQVLFNQEVIMITAHTQEGTAAREIAVISNRFKPRISDDPDMRVHHWELWVVDRKGEEDIFAGVGLHDGGKYFFDIRRGKSFFDCIYKVDSFLMELWRFGLMENMSQIPNQHQAEELAKASLSYAEEANWRPDPEEYRQMILATLQEITNRGFVVPERVYVELLAGWFQALLCEWIDETRFHGYAQMLGLCMEKGREPLLQMMVTEVLVGHFQDSADLFQMSPNVVPSLNKILSEAGVEPVSDDDPRVVKAWAAAKAQA
jgi:hypothetical protein